MKTAKSHPDMPKAMRILRKAIGAFPFASPPVSARVTATITNSAARFEGALLIIINASEMGLGKTTLAKLIAENGYGGGKLVQAPRNQHQWNLSLSALLNNEPQVGIFEDVPSLTRLETLEAFVISPKWTFRRRGSPGPVTLRNRAVVIVTGIGLKITPDLARRAIVVNLAPVVRPFAHKPSPAFAMADESERAEPNAFDLIAFERVRQIAKGYDARHDEGHPNGALSAAGACFAEAASAMIAGATPLDVACTPPRNPWPFGGEMMISADPLKMLVKGAAMLFAEIERVQNMRAAR